MIKNRPGYEQVRPGIWRKINNDRKREPRKIDMQEVYKEVDERLAEFKRPAQGFFKDVGPPAIRRSGIMRAIKSPEAEPHQKTLDETENNCKKNFISSTPYPKQFGNNRFADNLSALLSPITVNGYTNRRSRDAAVNPRSSRSLDKLGQNKISQDADVIMIDSSDSFLSMPVRRSRRETPSTQSRLTSEQTNAHTQTKSAEKAEVKQSNSRIPVQNSRRDSLRSVTSKRSLSEPPNILTNIEVAPRSLNSDALSGDQPHAKNQTVVVFSKAPECSNSRRTKSPNTIKTRHSLSNKRSKSTEVRIDQQQCLKVSDSKIKNSMRHSTRLQRHIDDSKPDSSKGTSRPLNKSRRFLEQHDENLPAEISANQSTQRKPAPRSRRHLRSLTNNSTDDDLPTKDTNQEVALSPIETITSVVVQKRKPGKIPIDEDSSESEVERGDVMTQGRSRVKRGEKSLKSNEKSERTYVRKVSIAVSPIGSNGLAQQEDINGTMLPVTSDASVEKQNQVQVQTCRDVALSPIQFPPEEPPPPKRNAAVLPKSTHSISVQPMSTQNVPSNTARSSRSSRQQEIIVQHCSVSPFQPSGNIETNKVRRAGDKEVQNSAETFYNVMQQYTTSAQMEGQKAITVNQDNSRSPARVSDSACSSENCTRLIEDIKANKYSHLNNIFDSLQQVDPIEELADFSNSNEHLGNLNEPWRFSVPSGFVGQIPARTSVSRTYCYQTLRQSRVPDDIEDSHLDQNDVRSQRMYVNSKTAAVPARKTQVEDLRSNTGTETENFVVSHAPVINTRVTRSSIHKNKESQIDSDPDKDESRAIEKNRAEERRTSTDEIRVTEVDSGKRQTKNQTANSEPKTTLQYNHEHGFWFDPRCEINIEALGRELRQEDFCCKGQPHVDNPSDRDNADLSQLRQYNYETHENIEEFLIIKRRRPTVKGPRKHNLSDINEMRKAEKRRQLDALFGGGANTKDVEVNTTSETITNKQHKEVLLSDGTTQTSLTPRPPLTDHQTATSTSNMSPAPKDTPEHPAHCDESSVFYASVRPESPVRKSPVRKTPGNEGPPWRPAGSISASQKQRKTRSGQELPKSPKRAQGTMRSNTSKAVIVSPTVRGNLPIKKVVELEEEACNTDTAEDSVHLTNLASLGNRLTEPTPQLREAIVNLVHIEDMINPIARKVRGNSPIKKVVELEEEACNTDTAEDSVHLTNLASLGNRLTEPTPQLREAIVNLVHIEDMINPIARKGEKVRNNLFVVDQSEIVLLSPPFSPILNEACIRPRTVTSPKRTGSRTRNPPAYAKDLAANNSPTRSKTIDRSRRGRTARSPVAPSPEQSRRRPETTKEISSRRKEKSLVSSVPVEASQSYQTLQDDLVSTSTNLEPEPNRKRVGNKKTVRNRSTVNLQAESDYTVSSSTRPKREIKQKINIYFKSVDVKPILASKGKRTKSSSSRNSHVREKSASRKSPSKKPLKASTSEVGLKRNKAAISPDRSGVQSSKKSRSSAKNGRNTRVPDIIPELPTVPEEQSQMERLDCASEIELASVELNPPAKPKGRRGRSKNNKTGPVSSATDTENSQQSDKRVSKNKTARETCQVRSGSPKEMLRLSSEPIVSGRRTRSKKSKSSPVSSSGTDTKNIKQNVQREVDHQNVQENQRAEELSRLASAPLFYGRRTRSQDPISSTETDSDDMKRTVRDNRRAQELSRLSSEPVLYEPSFGDPNELLNPTAMASQSAQETNDKMAPPPSKRAKGRPKRLNQTPVSNCERIIKEKSLRKVRSENAVLRKVTSETRSTRRRKLMEENMTTDITNTTDREKDIPSTSSGYGSQLTHRERDIPSTSSGYGSQLTHNDCTADDHVVRPSTLPSQSQLELPCRGFVSDANFMKVVEQLPEFNNWAVNETLQCPKEKLSMGYITLGKGVKKPYAASYQHSSIFLVLKGIAVAEFPDRKLTIEECGHFFVSTGQQYSIENKCEDKLMLFYVRMEQPIEND